MKHQGYAALLGALLLATPLAHADIIEKLGWDRVRPDTKNLSKVYGGAGFANSLMYFSAEAPTRYGNVYARVGQFYKGSGVAGQLGWRYPYAYTGVDKNGYYLGGFVGHVEDGNVDNERFNRLGGGVELSYLSMREDVLASASVALAFGDTVESSDGKFKSKPAPMIIFAANFNVGFF